MAELREMDGATTLLENEKHPADYEDVTRELSRAWFVGTPTRPIREGERVGVIIRNFGPSDGEVTHVEDLGGGRVKVTVAIHHPQRRRR